MENAGVLGLLKNKELMLLFFLGAVQIVLKQHVKNCWKYKKLVIMIWVKLVRRVQVKSLASCFCDWVSGT